MKIKEFFKNFNIFSKKYLIFVFLIILAITIVHNILVYVSYRSHKDSLEKKYLSYAILAGNSYEIFLDNVFHQAEFYGKKINNNYNKEVPSAHLTAGEVFQRVTNSGHLLPSCPAVPQDPHYISTHQQQ